MSDEMLPNAFSALEPFARKWCLATERERFEARLSSSVEEMQAFYDAFGLFCRGLEEEGQEQ